MLLSECKIRRGVHRGRIHRQARHRPALSDAVVPREGLPRTRGVHRGTYHRGFKMPNGMQSHPVDVTIINSSHLVELVSHRGLLVCCVVLVQQTLAGRAVN